MLLKTKALAVLAAGAAFLGVVSPAQADTPGANSGGTFTVAPGEDDAVIAQRVAQHAEEVHAMTPANKLCTGTWNHAVSTVAYQRAPGGTLAWGFWLTSTAKANLGPVATVSMPYAHVNGKAINPPYSPHTQGSGYNFHGSMNRYQFIGGSAGTIATGNKLTFYWFIKGSKPNTAADRYITCQVPTPGSA